MARDIIGEVIAVEGGYVDHPSDKGGPTKYGITAQTLADWRGVPCGAQEVAALSEDEARAIYEDRFVRKPRFDQVAALSPRIGEEVIDTGVNAGPGVAAEILQRWLTALNQQGRDYPDLKPDGVVGPVTLTALRAFLTKRGAEGERVLLVALNCSQGHRYLELAEGRVKNEDFLYGWLRERVAAQIAEA